MDWNAVIRAYPDQTNIVLSVRTLRDKIDQAIGDVELPLLTESFRDMKDTDSLVLLIAPVCTRVWKEVTGADPAFDMIRAISAIVGEGDLSGMADEERGRLEAIVRSAFSRFLFLLRTKNGRLVPERWNRGDCPFCGEYARIGFDEEDKRTLHCLTCGHTWRFPRLKCPSCGNADHTSLGYFEADGVNGVRVYFCRECMRYIKIVDRRVRPDHDAETEDALTLELDDLAKKENFS